MSIYYYLDDRYNIRNRDVSIEEIKPTLNKLIDFEIQNFSADFFAEKLQGRKEYFITPEKEIDFIITKRNKPDMVGEVKWKNAGINDIKQFKKASDDFPCRKVLVCKKGTETNEIELIDAEKLCGM